MAMPQRNRETERVCHRGMRHTSSPATQPTFPISSRDIFECQRTDYSHLMDRAGGREVERGMEERERWLPGNSSLEEGSEGSDTKASWPLCATVPFPIQGEEGGHGG